MGKCLDCICKNVCASFSKDGSFCSKNCNSFIGFTSVKDGLPAWFEPCLCKCIVPQDGGHQSTEYTILHITDPKGVNWNCTGIVVTHWILISDIVANVDK